MSCLKYFAVLAGSLLLTSPCFSQQASFQGLGDFPTGDFESAAESISADGAVVIGYGSTNWGLQAFCWTESTGFVSLGNLPDSSFNESAAYDVSSDGGIIVGFGGTNGMQWNSHKGFIWTPGQGMLEMGSLDGATRFEAWSVSADGSVLVGDGGQQAFRWTQSDGIKGLGILPGRLNSRAVDVSADGSVAVGSSYDLPSWNNEQAFCWTQSDGMVGLGYLSAGSSSFANAVSPDGSVIVGTSSSISGFPGFRWTQSTGMESLGHLSGMITTHPFGLSTDGAIIVGSSFTSRTNSKAFIWDSSHGMRDLNIVLQNDYTLDLTGWNLQAALDITPDGKVIVGYGINPSGQQEAFRAVLDTVSAGVQQKTSPAVSENFKLQQNYPNPFNPSTTIRYSLSRPSAVALRICNVYGQVVRSFSNDAQTAGDHFLFWDAKDDMNQPVSSGIYFYTLSTKDMLLQKKMILVR